MNKPTILITKEDHAILSRIIADRSLCGRNRAEVQSLAEELQRAEIVPAASIPSDVVTMHSRAQLRDLDTNESMEFTIVLPEEAKVDEGKISILAPVGAGMLGYRVGDAFEWPAPHGTLRLKVLAVTYQPEAAHQPNAA